MISNSLQRRLGLVAAAAALAGGLGLAELSSVANATAGSEPIEPVDVAVSDDYWACLALDYVEVGTCIENPLPDLSGYPTVPDMLHRLLNVLPL